MKHAGLSILLAPVLGPAVYPTNSLMRIWLVDLPASEPRHEAKQERKVPNHPHPTRAQACPSTAERTGRPYKGKYVDTLISMIDHPLKLSTPPEHPEHTFALFIRLIPLCLPQPPELHPESCGFPSAIPCVIPLADASLPKQATFHARYSYTPPIRQAWGIHSCA